MVRDKIFKAIECVVLSFDIDDTPRTIFTLEAPQDIANGDYASNAAFALAKKQGKPILEVAQELINKINADGELTQIVSDIKIAGPGFINFYLKEELLKDKIAEMADDTNLYKKLQLGHEKKVLVEYSSPNIAKNFSVGHLRSTIIGQALVNLFGKLGYEVIGENHLGDWGTQFGMVIAGIKKGNVDIENITLSKLEELYVQFSSESKVNPELRDEARNWFKKLEQGDPEARSIWEKVVAISKLEFEKVYDLLGVHIDNAHGESFYEDKVQAVIDEVIKKGLSRDSEGAKIVEFDAIYKAMPPAMLVKSDGTTTYFARDLAAIRYRLDTFDPDIFIYEVGAEQTLHFKQVFATAALLGWKMQRVFVHVAHGLVLVNGKKMSTREGTNVGIQEVLDQAIAKAKNLSKDSSDDLSKQVGIGAVKYFDLSHHPTSTINFDWDKMLSLDGNSGPYLQYSYARAKSVLNKNTNSESPLLRGASPASRVDSTGLYFEASELALARKIYRFDDAIVSSTQMYSPNILCEYLFDLARDFNGYYNDVKILGSDGQESKLVLVAAASNVIKEGLGLLGIEAPGKM